MYLRSVSAINNFPKEKIIITLDDSLSPVLNSTCGFYFSNLYWDDIGNMYKFGGPHLYQAGSEWFVISSTSLSSQYDLSETHSYPQGVNYLDLPNDYPLFLETSAIPFHELVMVFYNADTSETPPIVTVFPSVPFPRLIKINSASFTVSGNLFPLSAGESSDIFNNVKKKTNPNSLPSLLNYDSAINVNVENYVGPSGQTQLAPDFYYSASRRNVTWASLTVPVSAQVFLDSELPDVKIIPESFSIYFPLSAQNSLGSTSFTISFGNTTNGTHYLSSLYTMNELEPLESAVLDAHSGKISLSLKPNFLIPASPSAPARINVSYETSALSYIKSLDANIFKQTARISNSATNTFTVSSEIAPYLMNYRFMLSSMSLPTTRDAFTISFTPSAFFIPYGATSAVILSTVMVDNYNQIHFPLRSNDINIMLSDINPNNQYLSAIDLHSNIVYTENQWIPGSAYLKLFNDDITDFYTIYFTASSITNSLWGIVLPSVGLNVDQLNINLIQTSFNDNSATVVATNALNYDVEGTVRWSVSPSNNIVLTNSLGNVPLNTDVAASDLTVNVTNLGVGPTVISLYMAEFGVTASTTWLPSSAAFVNAYVVLSGVMNDFGPIKTASISALMRKDNRYYPVPTGNSISWEETYNNLNTTTNFYDANYNELFENTPYNATSNNSVVNVWFTTPVVLQNPQNVSFNIETTVLSNAFGTESSVVSSSNFIILNAREYPLLPFYAQLSTDNNDEIISTLDRSVWTFNSSRTITASACTSAFNNFPSTNLIWTLPNGSSATGFSTTFNLTTSGVLSFSAISATPIFGGFSYYTFIDSITFYVDNAPEFDYIAIPKYKYFPSETLLFSNGTYTNTVGLTALQNCGSQVISISAAPNFDYYYYTIGTKTVSAVDNIVDINVEYADVSASSVVQVWAIDERFPESNGKTLFNYASSDNSDIYHQTVSFENTPAISAVFSISRNVFNTDVLATTFFTTDTTFTPANIDVQQCSFVYVLSASSTIRVSPQYTINDLVTQEQFSNNLNDFFAISADTYNLMNLYLSGNLVKSPNGLCSFNQPFSSNIIPITAYDGINPQLQIFTKTNLNTTNETVYFTNNTVRVLPYAPSMFMFDAGTGNIQTVYSAASSLTGLYSAEGVYSVSLTAIVEGTPVSKTWDDFIVIKDTFTGYTSANTRQFPDKLSLPFESVCITPNAWQTETVLNDSFRKLQNNFDYLSAMTTTFDINVPKYYVGYWATAMTGTQKWSYQLLDNIVPQKFIDFIKIADRFVIINDNAIEIRNHDFVMSIRSVITNITEGERFITPTRLAYNSEDNKLFVLDQALKLIFVFSLENDALTLLYYWGGAGERLARTSLNKPTDICLDNEHNLFIVDSESAVIKVYNKASNWIYNISHSEWNDKCLPISASSSSNNTLFVLTSSSEVYVFEESVFQRKFSTKNGNRIFCDKNISGLLYILSDNIYTYGENGVFINTFSVEGADMLSLVFDQNEIYSLSNSAILKYINYIEYKTILLDDDEYWSWDSIFIDHNEPVTDFVLNDSFKKIHDNLLLLSLNLTQKFGVILDEYGNFSYHNASLRTNEQKYLSASSFVPIGLNEVVSYDVLSRVFGAVNTDLLLLKKMIDAEYIAPSADNLCWTWQYHTINQSQSPNNNIKPFSWIEMKGNNIFKPALSAITWLTARICCGSTNTMDICWTWGNMGCRCVLPYSWSEMQCDNMAKTWEEMAKNCCTEPLYFYDNCFDNC